MAELQAATFFTLLDLADLNSKAPKPEPKPEPSSTPDEKPASNGQPPAPPLTGPLGGLRYNIEIHLPATKDVEVFNAIIKSLKEHLLEH